MDPGSPAELKRRFNGSSTATEVLANEDVKGKTFLITGGTAGVGLATVEALALKGAHVVFTGRNAAAAEQLVFAIRAKLPDAKVTFMALSLCSLEKVRQFAKEFLQAYSKLDVLIFNAGMFGGGYHVTENGYETAFQVNVLSQLYLLELLKPVLVNSAPTRVVFVSSESHRKATADAYDLTEEVLSPPKSSYYSWRQYANSKLCQISLVTYLQENWSKYGMTFYALHPGSMIATDIGRSFWGGRVIMKMLSPFTKTLDQGAATTVYCAAASEVSGHGGKYWNNCWLCDSSRIGQELQFATSVWNLCHKMITEKVPEHKPSS